MWQNVRLQAFAMGLGQHIGPIFNANMFQKKGELNHSRWYPYATTEHWCQTNLHYATTEDLWHVSDYDTQKEWKIQNKSHSKLIWN
jgi:hypothetical protein